jgi:hypothetical protein
MHRCRHGCPRRFCRTSSLRGNSSRWLEGESLCLVLRMTSCVRVMHVGYHTRVTDAFVRRIVRWIVRWIMQLDGLCNWMDCAIGWIVPLDGLLFRVWVSVLEVMRVCVYACLRVCVFACMRRDVVMDVGEMVWWCCCIFGLLCMIL